MADVLYATGAVAVGAAIFLILTGAQDGPGVSLSASSSGAGLVLWGSF
ncbi:MAG: hypothetical protein AB1938_24045 [Myxococcota bacterium]